MAGKNNHVVRSLHCLTVCVKSGEHVHSLLLLTPIADGAVRADLQERLGKLRREQALRLGEGLKLLLSIEV